MNSGRCLNATAAATECARTTAPAPRTRRGASRRRRSSSGRALRRRRRRLSRVRRGGAALRMQQHRRTTSERAGRRLTAFPGEVPRRRQRRHGQRHAGPVVGLRRNGHAAKGFGYGCTRRNAGSGRCLDDPATTAGQVTACESTTATRPLRNGSRWDRDSSQVPWFVDFSHFRPESRCRRRASRWPGNRRVW